MSHLSQRGGARIRWAAITGLLCVPAAGCVFSPQAYPERWAPLSPIDHCRTLAGRYAPKGEDGGPNGARYSPAPLLRYLGAVPEDWKRQLRVDNAEWVELSYPDDRTLRVRAFEGGDAIAGQTFAEANGTLACTDDGAKILAHHGLPIKDALGYEWSATYLRRAQDGSLILQHEDGAIALALMLIPIAGSTSEWLRFPPQEVNAAPSRQPRPD